MSRTNDRITTELLEPGVIIENKVEWKKILTRGTQYIALRVQVFFCFVLCILSFALMGNGVWILIVNILPILKGLFFLWSGIAVYFLLLLVLLPKYLPEAYGAIHPTLVKLYDFLGKFFCRYAIFFMEMKKGQTNEKK